MSKLFAGVLLTLGLLLQYRLWLSDDGVREVRQLQEALAQQSASNAELKRHNEQLAAEVSDLRSGTVAIEERARSELGMIGPSESFYQVVPRIITAPVQTVDDRTRTAQR